MGSTCYSTQSKHGSHRAINQSGQIRNFSPLTWTNMLCFGMGSTGVNWKMWPTIFDYLWLISGESNQWLFTSSPISQLVAVCIILYYPQLVVNILVFALQNPQPGPLLVINFRSHRSKHCGSANFYQRFRLRFSPIPSQPVERLEQWPVAFPGKCWFGNSEFVGFLGHRQK
jgi:hypothetical protein